MTKELADGLHSTGQVEARHDYSGRGTFGSTTSAVVYESLRSLMKAVALLGAESPEALAEVQKCPWRVDILGHEMIAY